MIIQKSKVKLKNPYLICGWPGIGLVGHYIVNYLISQLNPQIFAEIDYQDYIIPHNAFVENGIIYSLPQIQNKFYYLKTQNYDFLFFTTEIEPSFYNMKNLAKDILEFLQPQQISLIITFGGIPSNILHTDISKLYIAKTHPQIKFLNLPKLNYGVIEGIGGIILSLAKDYDLEGVCIFSEIPFYTIDMLNPQAAFIILELLEKTFCLGINFEKVKQDIKAMDERIRATFSDLNEKAQMLFSQMISNQKKPLIKETETGITFEELKKQIKFSLPESAKNKINELFSLAQQNIEYAKQLKEELDKWGVYKEYEDKFLSLFLKNKKKGQNK